MYRLIAKLANGKSYRASWPDVLQLLTAATQHGAIAYRIEKQGETIYKQGAV